jgi:hypothetical protein
MRRYFILRTHVLAVALYSHATKPPEPSVPHCGQGQKGVANFKNYTKTLSRTFFKDQ